MKRDVTRRIVLQVMLALALAAPAAAWWISAPSEENQGPPSPAPPTPTGVVTDALAARFAYEFAGLSEEATMVLVGTALLGAAAAVRRAA